MKNKLQKVCDLFGIEGTFLGYEEITVGNVNSTYKVIFRREDDKVKEYIAQRLNTYVFKKPEEVMENIDKVTEFIHVNNPGKKVLHFHHTQDRKIYVTDGENGFWRLFNYITSSTYNESSDPEIVYNGAVAFGEFQTMLAPFDPKQLHVTIPDFHNTRKRFETLEKDVEKDPCGRVKEVTKELEWLWSVKEKACTLTDMHERGELPLRVTHNDTKINNVLFEKDGTEALVVIDLDTVMPGLVGHDFGDAIRFAANTVSEDSPNWKNAHVDMNIFKSFTEGFLSRTAATLTDNEINTLGLSAFVLTVELATRFLDDYILGSPYFKINYPAHNLVRARCQIALAKDMMEHLDEMNQLVQQCVRKYR